MSTTALLVREHLDNARYRLPDRASRPTLLTSDPGERPITVLAISGPGQLQSLARLTQDVFARRLEQIDGVANVVVVGAPQEEIRVNLDPNRLRVYGLTAVDVIEAIRRANVAMVGGTVRRGQFRLTLRALTEIVRVDELLDVPVGDARERHVRLRDVGAVVTTVADPATLARLSGEPALGLVIYKDAGANTVTVTRQIRRVTDELKGSFPGLRIAVVAEQARFVTDALSNLGQEIVAGALLSCLVIVLMLGDIRSSFAIALMIPLSILVALVFLKALNVTINILSLGGLALGVGLLVDNAIVVAEASARLVEAGKGRADAARAACEQAAGPLLAGTITTVLVFGPIVFVQGLAGALFHDLSVSVALSLAASLVLALTLLPVMLGLSSSPGLAVAAGARAGRLRRLRIVLDRGGNKIKEWYEHGVNWSLDRPAIVLGCALTVLSVTAVTAIRMPREVLPQVDEGVVVASLHLPEGTSLDETVRHVARIEAIARQAGARGVYSRVGNASDEEILTGANPGGPNRAELILLLPDGKSIEFQELAKAQLSDLTAGSLTMDAAGQSEFGSLLGREGRSVRVEVAASSAPAAEAVARTVLDSMRSVRSLSDVSASFANSQPQLDVAFDRQALARDGIGLDVAARVLEGALGGVIASELRLTDHRVPIRVGYGKPWHENLSAALEAHVGGVSLGSVVTVRATQAPSEVIRSQQRPVMIVDGAVGKAGTSQAARDTREMIATIVAPAGVAITVAGADELQRRTAKELAFVGVLSVFLMYLVLAGEFESFLTPFVILTTVPLAAAGGILLLACFGQSLNAVSLIGLVVLVGMADNDAVVKLDTIRRLEAEGVPLREAIVQGGSLRLRAISMTSLTTVVGVVPLALGFGSGGELYRPLAIGVIGGSVTALAVTFFVLPAAYYTLARAHGRRL